MAIHYSAATTAFHQFTNGVTEWNAEFTDTITFMMWFMTDDITVWTRMFSWEGDAPEIFGLYLDDEGDVYVDVAFDSGEAATTVALTTIISNGTWYCAAVVASDNTQANLVSLRVYTLDGVEVAAGSTVPNRAGPFASPSKLHMGTFGGRFIDRAMAWNTALDFDDDIIPIIIAGGQTHIPEDVLIECNGVKPTFYIGPETFETNGGGAAYVPGAPGLVPTHWSFNTPYDEFTVDSGDFTITADPGTFVMTGTAAGLLRDSHVTADTGAYVMTGTDAGLLKASHVTADAGAYVMTGTDAALIKDSTVGADAGVYAMVGQDANLLKHSVLVCDPGAFVMTGTDAGFKHDAVLTAEPGAFVMTGVDATLTFSGGEVTSPQFKVQSRRSYPREVPQGRDLQDITFSAALALVYMPMAGETTEDTDIEGETVRRSFPIGGRLKSFTIVTESATFGSTTVSLHKNFSTSPAASVTIDLDQTSTRYKFDFEGTDASFLTTDIVHVSWDPTSSPTSVRGLLEWALDTEY